MTAKLVQLLFALSVIALVGFFTYKLTIAVAVKIIDLCYRSASFRIGVSLCLALLFFAVGLLQLKDFLDESIPSLSRFFPLSFLVSAMMLFLGLRK